MKIIKFRSNLIESVLSGEKTATFRMFDDKDLSVGDEVVLKNWETLDDFANAVIVEVREKKLREMTEADFAGHETYDDLDSMVSNFRTFYGDRASADTLVKIIKFELRK